MAIAVPIHLKDMIELITSRTLLHDLVESHIHDSGINWDKRDRDKSI